MLCGLPAFTARLNTDSRRHELYAGRGAQENEKSRGHSNNIEFVFATSLLDPARLASPREPRLKDHQDQRLSVSS